MPLMPTTKVWTSDDGVQIEYITYRTLLVDRIRNALSPDSKPTDEQSSYILSAATTTNITLPENPPLWAQALASLIKSGDWLKDPRADYDSLAYAPSDLLNNWFQGYRDTRDRSHEAPPSLQTPSPLKPDDEEEGPQDEDNPTTSAAPSLNVLSSTKSGTRSRGKTRRAI